MVVSFLMEVKIPRVYNKEAVESGSNIERSQVEFPVPANNAEEYLNICMHNCDGLGK